MSDASAPYGTVLDRANRWVEGEYTFRSGAQMVVQDPGAMQVQGLNGTGVAPAVAAGTGAGTGATITSQKGHDLGGSFVVTAAGTPAAGTIATVTFGTALSAAPVAVFVSVVNTTTPALVTTCYADTFTATGFDVHDTAALTATDTYLVQYFVVAS